MKSGALTVDGLAALTAPAFRRASAYHVESACGRWSIAKIGTADGFRYVLWEKREGQRPRWVSMHETYAAAEEAACRG